MLSEKTISIIKATVPVLQEGGEALTRHFYKRMFSHNPEVLPFFNSSNQETGAQQQALAAAICAYATHIDNLGVLSGAVELIAQKHASLRIKPEHYPVVGENLLESIKEVLGDAATDEIIVAWGEAYNFLANILIAREEQIYSEQAEIPGGWRDFKNFKVIKKEKESDVITSFYLEPEDGMKPPSFKAGQYITVRFPSPCGHTTMRNYSLSDKPHQNYLRISVKREEGAQTPEGYVSNLLHKQIEVGSILEIAPPCGEFVLNPKNNERLLVFIAAGVGITPILSMLMTALETMPERNIVLIHANMHESNQAFRSVIDNLALQHSNLKTHYCYSDSAPKGVIRCPADNVSEGFVDAALIKSVTAGCNADYYFCGPKQFMANIYQVLHSWNVPASQINFEFFGPRQEIENSSEKAA